MSCDRPELKERLVELLNGDAAELREHEAACAECARELTEMREAFGALDSWKLAPPSEAVLERAHRVARPKNLTGVLLGGLALAATCALIFHVQPGIAAQWGALAAVALSAAAWLLGVRAADRGRAGDPAFWTVALAGATLAVVSQPTVHGGSAACLGLALAAAAGPFALAAIGLQRGGGNAGWVVGAAAGLLGLAVIRLHCAGGGLPHAALHHLPVVLVFVAASRVAFRFRPAA